MSQQQRATEIAAKQMFVDNSFWDEVEQHLVTIEERDQDAKPERTADPAGGSLRGVTVRGLTGPGR
jgi:hypothetical protein